MDTRTGLIYEAESAAALAKKLDTDESDIVMLDIGDEVLKKQVHEPRDGCLLQIDPHNHVDCR